MRGSSETMLVAFPSSDQERWEADHHRQRMRSAMSAELKRLYEQLAEACKRKVLLLKKIEAKTGPQPPVVDRR